MMKMGPTQKRGKNCWGWLGRWFVWGRSQTGVLLGLVLVLVVFSALSPPFRQFDNLMLILLQASFIGIVAAGQTLVVLTGIPGFHANRRTQGYEWGLEQWCPDVKVVGDQTAEWEREKAVNVATMALQQRPEIDLFYGNSDEMGIGACIAAEKMGRKVNEDIWCVSIDGNDVTLDLIEVGKTTATLGVYPNLMGGVVIQQMEKSWTENKCPTSWRHLPSWWMPPTSVSIALVQLGQNQNRASQS